MRRTVPGLVAAVAMLGFPAVAQERPSGESSTIPQAQLAVCVDDPQILNGRVDLSGEHGTTGIEETGFFFICTTDGSVISLQENPRLSVMSSSSVPNGLFNVHTAIVDSSGMCFAQSQVVRVPIENGMVRVESHTRYSFIPRAETANPGQTEFRAPRYVDRASRLPRAATCDGAIEATSEDAVLRHYEAYRAVIDARRQQQLIEEQNAALRRTI